MEVVDIYQHGLAKKAQDNHLRPITDGGTIDRIARVRLNARSSSDLRVRNRIAKAYAGIRLNAAVATNNRRLQVATARVHATLKASQG